MPLFRRNEEMPNGSVTNNAHAPVVTPSVSPTIRVQPVEARPEPEPKYVSDDVPAVETASVTEETTDTVSTDTTPINLPVVETEEQETPWLYNQRLHIKYMLTFYGKPLVVVMVILGVIITVPVIWTLIVEFQEAWAELEEVPLLGIFAVVIRIIIFAIAGAFWRLAVSLYESTGWVGGLVMAVAAAMIVVGFVVMLIRPIYAWRKSRVQVGYEAINLIRPPNKYLFLGDHTIRIKDTSIVRGATEVVYVTDQWLFPGAASIVIDKDDLGGTGDNKPWEPVRNIKEIVAAVEQVVNHNKAQRKSA